MIIRLKLFVKYLQNKRIDEYDSIIRKAKNANYNIISLRDYIEEKYDKDKKLLVLRHDVDHISNGTKMMFEIEKKHGVTASYYFRNSTFVFASVVTTPLSFFVYFSRSLWTMYVSPAISISAIPVEWSLFWLITFTFFLSFLEVELKIVYRIESMMLDLPEKFFPKMPTMPSRLSKLITFSSP